MLEQALQKRTASYAAKVDTQAICGGLELRLGNLIL